MTDHTIGIDISKSYCDAFRFDDEAAVCFENSSRGLKSLTKWLGATPVAQVVFDATGAGRVSPAMEGGDQLTA